VASKTWASANPDVARRFVAAMRETARWANTHHEDTARILAPVTHIDLATFATMQRSTYAAALSRDLLQPAVDVAVRYGALKAPFDTAELVAGAAPYQPR
jgi:ABC-type nitrate/sulfonate/bicarbonate transport system substrate-binding protein